MIDRDGRDLMVHPNKGGFVFVYDRSNGKVDNVWRLVQNINFVKDIDPKTGELIGRRDMVEGSHKNLCPAIAGGISWNSGAYSPQTGLYYKIGQEWCMDLDVVKTTPILEPMAQLNIGANFKLRNPEGGKAHGHVSARDPITGEKKWEVKFPEPPLASLLVDRRQPGVRAGCARHAARLQRRPPARSCGRTTTASATSAASSATRAGGKQYVAVMTGWGSLVGDEYRRPVRRPLPQHGRRTPARSSSSRCREPGDRDEGGRARPRPAASVGFDQSHEPIRVSVDLRTGLGRDAARLCASVRRGSADGGRVPPAAQTTPPATQQPARRSIRTSAACSRPRAAGAIRAAAGLPAADPSSPAPTSPTTSSSARSRKASRPACRLSAGASTMTRSRPLSPTSAALPERLEPRRTRAGRAALRLSCSPSPPSARSGGCDATLGSIEARGVISRVRACQCAALRQPQGRSARVPDRARARDRRAAWCCARCRLGHQSHPVPLGRMRHRHRHHRRQGGAGGEPRARLQAVSSQRRRARPAEGRRWRQLVPRSGQEEADRRPGRLAGPDDPRRSAASRRRRSASRTK